MTKQMHFSGRPIKIGLLWHSFTSDNLGVGALTESQVAICQAAAQKAGVRLEYVVFGFDGARSYYPKTAQVRKGGGISLKQMLLGQSDYLRDVQACDLILDIGEGDSFADIYGKRRFRVQMASKFGAIFKGTPLVLSPQTIGPFNGKLARMVATYAMRRCAKVFTRDGMSTQYAREQLGVSGVQEIIDVAFKLPFVRPAAEPDAPIRIGLNISGLLYSGGYAGNNQFDLTVDYRQHVRQLLNHWRSTPNVEVWLIPHVLSDALPRDDDRVAISEIAREFDFVKTAPSFASPSEAKSFISGMQFLTGARMHACIAAISSGVAVVPFAYSRKFNGLFSSLDYQWVADGRAMSTDEATAAVLSGFEQREALRAAAIRGANLAESKLQKYEDFLTDTFRSVAGAAQLGLDSTHGDVHHTPTPSKT